MTKFVACLMLVAAGTPYAMAGERYVARRVAGSATVLEPLRTAFFSGIEQPTDEWVTHLIASPARESAFEADFVESNKRADTEFSRAMNNAERVPVANVFKLRFW